VIRFAITLPSSLRRAKNNLRPVTISQFGGLQLPHGENSRALS